MTPEGKVKEKVREILKRCGAQYFMPSAGVYGRSGASDFICCYRGVYIALECKATAQDKPTRLQELFMKQVNAAGGRTFVIHAGNVSELEGAIHALG
jgi:penicillin-binding protein-related factor A (putative recombinase)